MRLLAAATALIAMSVSALGGLSGTAPSDSTAPGSQDVIADFNTWITLLPEQQRIGYIQSEDDVSANSVQIDWNGDTGGASFIVDEGRKRGIDVSVKPYKWSRDEIEQVATTGLAIGANEGSPLTSTAVDVIPADGGSPIVYLASNGEASSTTPSRVARMVKVSDQELSVSYRISTSPPLPATGRSTDFSPFNSGGYMLSGSGQSTCSVGFGVVYYGVSHVTTARHCNEGGWHDRSASNSYGSISHSNSMGALLLGAHASGLNFDGSWNQTNFTKNVKGLRVTNPGDWVCTDGGNSGVHCYVKVTSIYVYWNDGHGTIRTDNGVEQHSGIAAIQGDSGGPVLTTRSDGGVNAAGMIQAIAGTILGGSSCGSVHDLYSNKCSKTVLYSDFESVIFSWGRGHVFLKTS